MKSLLIANWKMNPQTLAETKQLFGLVKKGLKNIKKVEVVICPPFVFLSNVLDAKRTPRRVACQMSNVILGAQDCFWEEKGAFTGEISPVMLKNLGVEYVIIGHSERRRHLKETDKMINEKIKAAKKQKLTPILCVGETPEERQKGQTKKILRKQIISALRNVSGFMFQVSGLVIAYEPIWAIGTGNACDPDEAGKGALLIRKIIAELYSSKIAEKIPILYGGSVNSENAANYIKTAGMDGLLVGGASLRAQEFIKIVKSIS